MRRATALRNLKSPYERRDLQQHLLALGCLLLREGGRHSWWHHPVSGKRSAPPRHNEIITISPEKSVAISVFPSPKAFDIPSAAAGDISRIVKLEVRFANSMPDADRSFIVNLGVLA